MACNTSSKLLLPERTDSPLQAPTVDCKQPATPPIAMPPCAACWVTPVNGVAQLSQQAASWIVELLGTVDKERALRAEEHRCLDEHEARGIIKQ